MLYNKSYNAGFIRHGARFDLHDKVSALGLALTEKISFERSRLSVQFLDKVLRAIRAAIGGVIILTIAAAMVIPQFLPVTGNSVVNAKLEWIRTPIEGDLKFAGFKVGDTVTEGAVIGVINNERADDSYFNQLKNEQSALDAALFSLAGKSQYLESRRADLNLRVTDSLSNLQGQTGRRINIIQSELALSYQEMAEIDVTIDRYEKANRDYSGTERYAIVSRAMLEGLSARQTEIQAVISQRIKTLQILETDLQAAITGAYSSDNTPPEQKQLIDTEQVLVSFEAEKKSLSMKAAILAETIEERLQHLDRKRRHELVTRVTGTLWDIGYADGSYVHNGDSVFAVADTDSLSVEAHFHQRYLDNISVGDHATIDLMGSSDRLTGKVTEVRIRDQIKSADLSAFNFGSPQKNEFKVVVTLDESQMQTPHIGQRAKVLVSKSESAIAPHLLLFFNR